MSNHHIPRDEEIRALRKATQALDALITSRNSRTLNPTSLFAPEAAERGMNISTKSEESSSGSSFSHN